MEKENLPIILKRLEKILNDFDYEILIVDDNSPDKTAEIAKEFAKRNKRIKVFVRKKRKGLASAILCGIKKSKNEIVCVLDADLQHPPELIPKMFKKLEEKKADIAIASRFIEGSKIEGLNFLRRFMSRIGSFVITTLFPKISHIHDPLSGFFILKKEVIRGIRFKALGFKFLLEVLVKGNYREVVEIPFTFHKRRAGKSKLTLKESKENLKLVFHLFKTTKEYRRIGKFFLVGMSGIFVNEGLLWLLTEIFKIYYLFSALLSIETSIISNFILNEIFVFHDLRKSGISNFFKRMVRFNLTRIGGLIINICTLFFLVEFFKFNYLVANLIGILLAFLWNYATSVRIVWRIKIP